MVTKNRRSNNNVSYRLRNGAGGLSVYTYNVHSHEGTHTFNSFEYCASLRLSQSVLLIEHLSRQAVLKTLLLLLT